MRRPHFRSLGLLILLASVPACADRPSTPPPAATSLPQPPATQPPQPPGPDHLAPMPREVKAREPIGGTIANDGRKLFLKLQCVNCHSGTANAKAPTLEALYGSKAALQGDAAVTVDEAYLVESIRRPKAKVVKGWEPIMPAYDDKQISAEEMIGLIAYIKSLKFGDLKPKGAVFPPPVGAPKEE